MDAPAERGRGVFLAWLPGPLAVGLGCGAHLASGGTVPPIPLLLGLAALLGLSAAMLSRVTLPGWAVMLLSGLAQQVLHLALSAFSGFTGAAGAPQPGHGHDASALPAPQLSSGMPAVDLHVMVYAHAAAALLTALAVSQGIPFAAWVRSVWGRSGDRRSLRRSAGEEDAGI